MMKILVSKITLAFLLLFLGLTNTKAATVNDCFFHVFLYELNQKNSKTIRNYFKELPDKDAKNAYDSWTVLYKSDPEANRLSIKNIKVLTKYMSDSKKAVDIVASEINNLKGFKKWKNVEYKFQKEGYEYTFIRKHDGGGSILISHAVKKKGEYPEPCGTSVITKDGVLENSLDVPGGLKDLEISKAIYAQVFKENIRKITAKYFSVGIYKNDNFKAFKKEYKISNNKVKAALATPQGRVIGKDWEPINIVNREKEIHVTWVKKGKVKSTAFKYKFEKEGYVYISKKHIDELGFIVFKHKLKRNGVLYLLGESRISPKGILNNLFEVPENLQQKEISKAMYNTVLKEDIKEINAYYMNEDKFSINLDEFMNEYEKSQDLEKAAMATPQGRVIGDNWKPISIKILNGEVHLRWVNR